MLIEKTVAYDGSRCLLLPNRGRLHQFALGILRSFELENRYESRRLCYRLRSPSGRVMFVRSEDIPHLLAAGIGSIGMTGYDYACEAAGELRVVGSLPAFEAKLTMQVLHDSPVHTLADIRIGARIVTQYPGITGRYLRANGRVDVEVVAISGAAEAYVYCGLADASVDVCCSGHTARANEMRSAFSIGETSAVVLKKIDSAIDRDFDDHIVELAKRACATEAFA